MDPITLMGSVTAAFNGLKAAVKVGQEVEGVYRQLSKWADAAGQLQQLINSSKTDTGEQKAGLFEKIGFGKSETAEAFDIIIAQQKLREMEKDIHTMFYYGELQHLGAEGYSQFNQLRREIRENRERMIRDQARRRKRFIENTFWGTLLIITFTIAIKFFVWFFDIGREAGKW
jgi:aminopeptidase N